VAERVQGLAVACDVGREADIVALVERATKAYGPIDLFCSNAGIATPGTMDVPDAEWQRIWNINVMAHVWAARAVVPGMLSRGKGYVLATASAAGLLSMIGSAPYAVTKHAAVAFAEWLSITYGANGIRVSCLCPQYVNTAMLHGVLSLAAGNTVAASGAPVLEAAQVADAVVAGIDAERFLILPHPEVATFFQHKANDYDRWLGGMRKLQNRK
jgi:NAD(P)-dependent dehydrogenase (short-subunit alcohol dehydrogenase family)